MSERMLEKMLNSESLREAAGDRHFERGKDYFNQGLVKSLRSLSGVVTAKVQGTETYQVRIEAAEDGLKFDCNCPLGENGTVCKHCAAVGLAWLNGRGVLDEHDDERENIRRHLFSMEKSRLVNLLMSRTEIDDDLFNRLSLVSRRDKVGDFCSSFRMAVDHATKSDDFIDSHSMRAFSRGLEDLAYQLSNEISSRPEECIGLAEYFLSGIERKLHSVDDSNGFMRTIVEHLEELHHAACVAAKPEPVALARSLFEWNLNSEWDIFYDAVRTHADVMGREGLAEFRRLAEKEWAKAPKKGLGAKSSFSDGTFRITSIMETLAEVSGDVEKLVAVMSRDLSSPYCFLKIAEVYQKAGRRENALEWAERGLKAFPQKEMDRRLRAFVADQYHRLKCHDEAMTLIWDNFASHARLEDYQDLKKHAELSRQWPQWRMKAIELLRRRFEEAKRKHSSLDSWFGPDKSDLVEIFLWEKDAEAAWDEAKDGGCSPHWWMKLAALREKDYPQDALTVYRDEIKRELDSIGISPDYGNVVRLVRQVRELMSRIRHDQEFTAYLDCLRTVYKRKRNFIKLLERVKPITTGHS